MQFKFKQLEVQKENKGIKSLIQSRQFRISAVAILIGAVAGFLYFYFSEGQQMETFVFEESLRSTLIGAFIGFFITNSPCARGRC